MNHSGVKRMSAKQGHLSILWKVISKRGHLIEISFLVKQHCFRILSKLSVNEVI